MVRRARTRSPRTNARPRRWSCGLRLREGIDTARVAALAGGTAPIDARAVARLSAQGLVAAEPGRLRVTEAGALLCSTRS